MAVGSCHRGSGSHQTRLSRSDVPDAVSEPGLLTEAVDLSGPNSIRFRRSLLCLWLQRLDTPALADRVVPDDRKADGSSTIKTDDGGGPASPQAGAAGGSCDSAWVTA